MIDRRTIPKDIDIKLEVFYQKCYRILCFCFARFDKLPSRREIMDYKRYKFVALSGTKDELAKGVKSTIRSLKAANIKIIMLTGDHPKTAKNIALSCDLASLTDECVLSKDNYKQYITNTNYIDFLLLNQMKHNEYAVFDAEMTKHVLKSPLQFLKWSKESKCIVFSRSTPDTKARVVDMYQSDKSQYIHASGHTNIVLAIGDGANDVAMLRRASLAVGIVGHEGRIAASSSDIAVDSFYRLQRLVLVHGAWNYLRGTLGILIFLYKNLAFSVPVLLYICFSDFSVAKIFDDWLMIGVVFFFTSFSLLPISSIDHQISDEKRLQYPVLYQASLSRKNYTAATIFEWLQAAFIHGSIPFLIIFFGANYFPFSTHYGKLINYQYLSIMTCLTTLIVVHAKIQLMMRHISLLSCILTQSSFVFFIIFLFLPIFNDPINRGYVKEVFLSWESYILIFLILFICLYRDLIWVWFKRMYWEHISLIYDNRKGLHKRLEMKPIRVLKNNLQRSTGQN
ncbi:MAG: aminophospholipid translocase [Marteilia pararefringens]